MKTYKVIVDELNTIRWYNEQGKLHREDGPAVEYADGSKSWFRNGQFHREDGPAVEYADGRKYWYINDKELTETEFNNRINKKAFVFNKNLDYSEADCNKYKTPQSIIEEIAKNFLRIDE